MDGMNIMRSVGFTDAQFTGAAREEFERMRREDNVKDKPAMAMALIAAIDHFLQANESAKAAGEPIEFKPMAFLPEWARDGGRTGSRKAFNAKALEMYDEQGYLTLTPSRRNDDEPQIAYAKHELRLGSEVILLTNDNFQDHIREQRISQEWFDAHVVSYLWLGKSNKLMLNLPHTANYPHI